MEKKLILGLVGPIASGKGTVAQYLKESHGASVYRFSTILRDVLERLHFEVSRENLQKLSSALRNSLREDILAKVMAEDTEKDNQDIVVVDGIRRWADIKHLRKKDNFILVGVDADPETRYKRLVKRAENKGDSAKTYEEFLEDEKQEADAEIPDILNQVSERLDNNNYTEELYKKIEDLLKKYGK